MKDFTENIDIFLYNVYIYPMFADCLNVTLEIIYEHILIENWSPERLIVEHHHHLRFNNVLFIIYDDVHNISDDKRMFKLDFSDKR